jgi:ribosomal protein S18 acetylase RimI-like enzyme
MRESFEILHISAVRRRVAFLMMTTGIFCCWTTISLPPSHGNIFGEGIQTSKPIASLWLLQRRFEEQEQSAGFAVWQASEDPGTIYFCRHRKTVQQTTHVCDWSIPDSESMNDIPTSPTHHNVGNATSPHNGYHQDVEVGSCDVMGRDDRNGDSLRDVILGECHGGDNDNNPLLGDMNPRNLFASDDNHPDGMPGSSEDQTICFREIASQDRKRIQELFEEWFPVDYKEEFYDNLCNNRTMGDQKLYTLLATTQATTHSAATTTDGSSSHENGDGQKIIACLLGCKLSARKLNEASRALLIPGYTARRGKSSSTNTNSGNSELDQTLDELDAGDDPNAPNGKEEDDEIDRTDVFYIMTLGVIEEYRKKGLATYLVERAVQEQITSGQDEDDGDEPDSCSDNTPEGTPEIYRAQTPNKTSSRYRCETVYLHVIIQNKAAIRFYQKLGFARLREIADYYTIDEKKHNCYLYAKFYDRASIERRRLGYCYYLPIVQSFVGGAAGSSPIVGLFHRTVTRWFTTIWSSISYYWVFESGEGGRNSVIAAAAAAKNK